MKPLATGVLLALIPKKLVLNYRPRVRFVPLDFFKKVRAVLIAWRAKWVSLASIQENHNAKNVNAENLRVLWGINHWSARCAPPVFLKTLRHKVGVCLACRDERLVLPAVPFVLRVHPDDMWVRKLLTSWIAQWPPQVVMWVR